MANYSIRDLENFTGIKAHTLRIWEKRYKIVEPKRTCTNIRYYTDDDLKKLLNVSILNKHGFKISTIVNFSGSEINKQLLNVSKVESKLNSQIDQLIIAMIDLDEKMFNQIFDKTVFHLGFEETILQLVYPFFQKVGILWQIGSINPAQEHFVSNLIRQRLIVAIHNLDMVDDDKGDLFVLFMPEGDYHELGLIFYHYLLKKNRQRVIYLGGSVPIKSLAELARKKKTDYLLTALIHPMEDESMEKYILNLTNEFAQVKRIILTGLQMTNLSFQPTEKIQIIDSVLSFKEYIQQL